MEIPFNERGVSVTRNSLSAAGQVFALREVQKVRVVTVQKNRIVPLVISLAGLAGAIAGGILGSSAGLVCGRLIVETFDGEREALSSTDREFVERVGQVVLRAKAAMQTAPAASAASAAPEKPQAQ